MNDKELQEQLYQVIIKHAQEFKAGHMCKVRDKIMSLIKAERERAVLEARINQIKKFRSYISELCSTYDDADIDDCLKIMSDELAELTKENKK